MYGGSFVGGSMQVPLGSMVGGYATQVPTAYARPLTQSVAYQQPVQMQVIQQPVQVQQVERTVEVPQTQVVQKTVEVPQVQVQYVDRQVPKVEIQEQIVQVPRIETQIVEKIVEVPQVQMVQKTVEVPQVQVQYVDRQVPKVQDAAKRPPKIVKASKIKYQVQITERAVERVTTVPRHVDVPRIHKRTIQPSHVSTLGPFGCVLQ